MTPHLGGGGGGWHEASVFVRLPLAAPIGLSPVHILTLRGSERVLWSCRGGGGGGKATAVWNCRCPVPLESLPPLPLDEALAWRPPSPQTTVCRTTLCPCPHSHPGAVSGGASSAHTP